MCVKFMLLSKEKQIKSTNRGEKSTNVKGMGKEVLQIRDFLNTLQRK